MGVPDPVLLVTQLRAMDLTLSGIPHEEVADELRQMVYEQLVYLENVETLAARIGLSEVTAVKVVADCSLRLKRLSAAWLAFDKRVVTTS